MSCHKKLKRQQTSVRLMLCKTKQPFPIPNLTEKTSSKKYKPSLVKKNSYGGAVTRLLNRQELFESLPHSNPSLEPTVQTKVWKRGLSSLNHTWLTLFSTNIFYLSHIFPLDFVSSTWKGIPKHIHKHSIL